MTRPRTLSLLGLALLAACTDEPPPRTVTEFVDNPLLLEAAMVRCQQDRAKSRYEQECINAREAARQLQADEEARRRAELEARSERKRKALRRTQEAQAEARRRASEAQRLREEAEYLAQFGELPPGDGAEEGVPEGNAPLVVLPEAGDAGDSGAPQGDTVPATDGGNAPVAAPEPPAEDGN